MTKYSCANKTTNSYYHKHLCSNFHHFFESIHRPAIPAPGLCVYSAWPNQNLPISPHLSRRRKYWPVLDPCAKSRFNGDSSKPLAPVSPCARPQLGRDRRSFFG